MQGRVDEGATTLSRAELAKSTGLAIASHKIYYVKYTECKNYFG